MKTTKHIIKLAAAIAKKDIKESTYYSDSDLDWLTENNAKHFTEVKEALLNGRYYTGVEKVSSSGMSRIIKIKYIKNNKLHGVSMDIYDMAGCDKNQRISGCGMDMLFAAQYNLFQTLCPNLRYQDKMEQYNNL